MSRRESSDVEQLESSGSIGYDESDIVSENTASLGLSESIANYSTSLAEVTNDDNDSYEFMHVEKTIKFLKSKVYDNREAIANTIAEDQRIYGHKHFTEPITGSLNGNANSSTTASHAETASYVAAGDIDGTVKVAKSATEADSAGSALYATKWGSKASSLTFTIERDNSLTITDGTTRWNIAAAR